MAGSVITTVLEGKKVTEVEAAAVEHASTGPAVAVLMTRSVVTVGRGGRLWTSGVSCLTGTAFTVAAVARPRHCTARVMPGRNGGGVQPEGLW